MAHADLKRCPSSPPPLAAQTIGRSWGYHKHDISKKQWRVERGRQNMQEQQTEASRKEELAGATSRMSLGSNAANVSTEDEGEQQSGAAIDEEDDHWMDQSPEWSDHPFRGAFGPLGGASMASHIGEQVRSYSRGCTESFIHAHKVRGRTDPSRA